MYEHLRNDFIGELSSNFNSTDIDIITSILDKVSANYDINEKETSLCVYCDEMLKLVKYYLASKKLEGKSENTIASYSDILRVFFSEVQKNPQDISTNDIRLFLAQYKQKRGISDRTLDKYRQIINGFFEWCVNEEYIVKNPCKNIKDIKFEVVPRRSLDRTQLELLRRACKTKRELAIVDVLYSTGCRVSELVNMRYRDVDFIKGTIQIIGKGKKYNTVYLNDIARLSLSDYLKERQGVIDYLFVNQYKPYNQMSRRSAELIFRNIEKEVGFRVTPHIIRHTTATLALQSGMEITQVQKMLNHSSVNTTQIYAETSQDEVAFSHRKYVV